MSKRKKAVKNRKNVTISTFALDGAADETEPLYQCKFDEGDMEWLADEYRKRSDSDPSVTLEEFAAQYGVPWDEFRLFYQKRFGEDHMVWLAKEFQRRSSSEPYLTLKVFANQHDVPVHRLSLYVAEPGERISHYVILWHGTSKSRAESIREEGFMARKCRSGRMFFTRQPTVADGYAHRRAMRENDQPAVITCSIDINMYDDFICPTRGVFAFAHKRIPNEVIRRVENPSTQVRQKREKRKKDKVEFTNVALAFGSSRVGVAYWLNSHLKLNDMDKISEDSEAVGKIKEWLDEQMDAGRFGEVPTGEMVEQVQEHLPQHLPERSGDI